MFFPSKDIWVGSSALVMCAKVGNKSMLKAIGKGDAVSHEDNPGAAADDGSGTKMM